MKLYKDGKVINASSEQVILMEKAGWSKIDTPVIVKKEVPVQEDEAPEKETKGFQTESKKKVMRRKK